MSTNSNCEFYQIEPSKWYYVLEDSDAPKNAFDWRENASCYGPFPTEEKADDHLRDNHANPGGSNSSPLPAGVERRDLSKNPVLADLIANARRPGSVRRFNRF